MVGENNKGTAPEGSLRVRLVGYGAGALTELGISSTGIPLKVL